MPYEWEDWAILALVGIEEREVRQALEARRRWPRRAIGTGGVEVLTLWARTTGGRPVIVAIYHAGAATWKIIGARDMTDKELVEFTDWEDAP